LGGLVASFVHFVSGAVVLLDGGFFWDLRGRGVHVIRRLLAELDGGSERSGHVADDVVLVGQVAGGDEAVSEHPVHLVRPQFDHVHFGTDFVAFHEQQALLHFENVAQVENLVGLLRNRQEGFNYHILALDRVFNHFVDTLLDVGGLSHHEFIQDIREYFVHTRVAQRELRQDVPVSN